MPTPVMTLKTLIWLTIPLRQLLVKKLLLTSYRLRLHLHLYKPTYQKRLKIQIRLTLTQHASIQKLLHGPFLLSVPAYRISPPRPSSNWLFTRQKSCLRTNLIYSLLTRFAKLGLFHLRNQTPSFHLRTCSKTAALHRLHHHKNLNLNLSL